MEIRLEGHYGYGRLMRSAVPLIAMMVLISLYSIVDGLFVSNLVGTTAFAALNLIWPALGLVAALGLMVGSGGAALVSKTLGEGDRPRANRYFSMFVEFILLLAVVAAVPLFIWMEPLAVSLGAEGEMVRQCVIYGRICAAGMPAFMMQMGIQPFFMVAERPQMGTYVSLASGLVNIGLDALFIIVFKMGLAGAAAGSMLACCVGGFVPLVWFLRQPAETGLHLGAVRLEAAPIVQAATNGLSEFVGNISFNIVSMCYNLQLMHFYGENGVAAYSVILYLGFIFIAVFMGYNLTVTPLVGFNYGADNRAELANLLRRSLKLMLALGVVLTATASCWPESRFSSRPGSRDWATGPSPRRSRSAGPLFSNWPAFSCCRPCSAREASGFLPAPQSALPRCSAPSCSSVSAGVTDIEDALRRAMTAARRLRG